MGRAYQGRKEPMAKTSDMKVKTAQVEHVLVSTFGAFMAM